MNIAKTQEKDTTKEKSHGNAENTNNIDYSKIIERTEVEGTPFTIVRYEKKYYITMGKYRITEEIKTKKEAEKEAKEMTWHKIMQIIGIMIEEYKPNNI